MDGLGLRKIWKDGKPTVGVHFFLSEKRLMRTYCMILFFMFLDSLCDVSKQVQVKGNVSQEKHRHIKYTSF